MRLGRGMRGLSVYYGVHTQHSFSAISPLCVHKGCTHSLLLLVLYTLYPLMIYESCCTIFMVMLSGMSMYARAHIYNVLKYIYTYPTYTCIRCFRFWVVMMSSNVYLAIILLRDAEQLGIIGALSCNDY